MLYIFILIKNINPILYLMYNEKKIIASGASTTQTLFYMHQLAPLKHTSLHTFEDDLTVEIYIILF